MTTTINKKFDLEEPIEKVWIYLADPTKIVTCVPGASLTEKIDDRNFKGQVAMKLGPVKVKFNGDVEIEDLDKANWKMQLKGKGTDAKGKGTANMKMHGTLAAIPTGTAVDFTMELSIIGKLAQFGSRLIKDVTDQVLNQFVDNFKAKLAADTDFVAEVNPTATAESMVDAPPVTAKSRTEDVVSKDATTQEKAKAVSDAAAEVQKAVADVQAAQNSLDNELKTTLASAGTVATNGVQKAKTAAPKVELPKTKVDNSLNGLSLMWMVVKGWVSKIFGGGK